MKKVVKLIFIFVAFHSSIQAQKKLNDRDIINLYNLMIGHFSSESQSKQDSTYFDIRLKMVPMWPNAQGSWLYVEQALSTSENSPYRQRVYCLNKLNSTTIECKVYSIKNEQNYIGEWKKNSPLRTLTIDSLEERKGCSIFITKNEKYDFTGSTEKNNCVIPSQESSYSTTSMGIFENMLIIWDKGFDKDDNQIFGAEKGGYVFNRTLILQ